MPRLSFGCEFEFLVVYLPPEREDPHAGQPGFSPLLRIRERGLTAGGTILEHVRQTLRAHGIPVRYPNDIIPGSGTVAAYPLSVPTRLRGLDMWDVTSDASVSEFRDVSYEWAGVELRTPASFAGKDAHRAIEYVLNVVKSCYRVRINPSAGFHVHVGNGREWFPPRVVKRLAALLFAADPTISRLHAPWRRTSAYSNSIRYESTLACGRHDARSARRVVRREPGLRTDRDEMVMSTSSTGSSYRAESSDDGKESDPSPPPGSDASNSDGQSFRLTLDAIGEEEEESENDPDILMEMYELFMSGKNAAERGRGGNGSPGDARGARKGAVRNDKSDTAATVSYQGTKLLPHDPTQLSREYRRGRLGNYDRLNWIPTVFNPRDPGGQRGEIRPVTTTWDGVSEIMACGGRRAGPSVGVLLSSAGHERLNYTFQSYTPFGYNVEFLSRRTIEFREAGGTLDSDWAITWSSICVGIVDWCRKPSLFRFLDVLERLKAQEDRDQRGIPHTDDERYDVCDFLDDLGLYAESEWVRHREKTSGPPR